MIDVNHLRTEEKHKLFHRARLMFCIKDGDVKIPNRNQDWSHLEWFEQEGWLSENNAIDFLNATVRGNYVEAENKLFCYKGVGFFYDDELQKTILKYLSHLVKVLNLKNNTVVILGPNEKEISGVRYEQKHLGNVGELLKIT